MRLLTSRKEAKTLQVALAEFIAKTTNQNDAITAQKLLARIAKCLELQGKSGKV